MDENGHASFPDSEAYESAPGVFDALTEKLRVSNEEIKQYRNQDAILKNIRKVLEAHSEELKEYVLICSRISDLYVRSDNSRGSVASRISDLYVRSDNSRGSMASSGFHEEHEEIDDLLSSSASSYESGKLLEVVRHLTIEMRKLRNAAAYVRELTRTTCQFGNYTPKHQDSKEATDLLKENECLKEQLADKTQRVDDLEHRLADKTQRVDDLEHRLADMTQHVDDLEYQVVDKADQAKYWESHFAKKKRELERMNVKFIHKSRQAKELQTERLRMSAVLKIKMNEDVLKRLVVEEILRANSTSLITEHDADDADDDDDDDDDDNESVMSGCNEEREEDFAENSIAHIMNSEDNNIAENLAPTFDNSIAHIMNSEDHNIAENLAPTFDNSIAHIMNSENNNISENLAPIILVYDKIVSNPDNFPEEFSSSD